MSPTLDTVVVSVIGSLTATSFFGVVALAVFKRWLDAHFDTKLLSATAELDAVKQARLRIAEARWATYPSIVEVIYRSKKELRASVPQVRFRFDFNEGCAELVALVDRQCSEIAELCIKHRFLLSDDLFWRLHDYKEEIRTIRTTLDAYKEVSGDPWSRVERCLDGIDLSASAIIADLRNEAGSTRVECGMLLQPGHEHRPFGKNV